MAKIKTYVLMISRVFAAYHPRAGQRTYFEEKIFSGTYLNPHATFTDAIINSGMYHTAEPKLHTIRENYDLWARRSQKINKGEAILSLRQWSGKPYASKQVEFLRLEKVGLQYIAMTKDHCYVDEHHKDIQLLAKNDGLSTDDFRAWFKKDFVGVILHFTDFKY